MRVSNFNETHDLYSGGLRLACPSEIDFGSIGTFPSGIYKVEDLLKASLSISEPSIT